MDLFLKGLDWLAASFVILLGSFSQMFCPKLSILEYIVSYFSRNWVLGIVMKWVI